jgi:hypothetical protein
MRLAGPGRNAQQAVGGPKADPGLLRQHFLQDRPGVDAGLKDRPGNIREKTSQVVHHGFQEALTGAVVVFLQG